MADRISFSQSRERRDERERYRDPRASHAAPARDASGAALAAPGAGVQRSGSKQGRKSGVPAGLQAADGGRTAALRQGGANADYASGGGAGSGYGGNVAAASNVAVHGAAIAPGQDGTHSPNGAHTPRGDSHHNTLPTQSNMHMHNGAGAGNETRISGAGNQQRESRGLAHENGAAGGTHPAERQSFGTKLVNFLTCRCG